MRKRFAFQDVPFTVERDLQKALKSWREWQDKQGDANDACYKLMADLQTFMRNTGLKDTAELIRALEQFSNIRHAAENKIGNIALKWHKEAKNLQ